MKKIKSNYEQFCPKHNQNILIEEYILEDGNRNIRCTNSHKCEEECLYIHRLKNYNFVSNLQN